MEVKIKNNEGMIDATIEVKDGIMIVSPVKFEPKDGDVVTRGKLRNLIAIFKKNEFMSFRSYAAYCDGKIYIDECFVKDDISLATEEERKKLFTRLAEEGYEWDVKERKLIKVKWEPLLCDTIWLATGSLINKDIFSPSATSCSKNMEKAYELGRVFKTKEECQKFCDSLNEAINQVKP